MKKRLVSFLTCLAMVFSLVVMVPSLGDVEASATQNRSSNFSKSYTLTGNGATDMVNIAKAQIGKTGSQLGYSEDWCADFVSDCARLAGQSSAIPANGSCYNLMTAIKNAGGSYVSTTSAKAGDILFYSSSSYPNGGAHVEIVYARSGSVLSTIGGNSGSGTLYTRMVKNHANQNGQPTVYKAMRPNYTGCTVKLPGTKDSKYNNLPVTVTASKQIHVYNQYKEDLYSDHYIDKGDSCYITEVYTDGYCYVQYPTSSGKVWYWAKASDFDLSSAIKHKVTVWYDANGGTVSANGITLTDNGVIYKNGSKFTETWTYDETHTNGLTNAGTFGLTRTGYTFKGWGTTSSGGTIFDPHDNTVTASQLNSDVKTKDCKRKLYAIWERNTLTISYNANGGTVSADGITLSNNVIYKNGNKYTVTWTYDNTRTNGLTNAKTLGLTRSGYTFKGWGTTSSGGTIFDQNDNTVTPSKLNSKVKTQNCSMTLYAIWEKNHTHSYTATVTTQPTCTATGVKTYKCSCGASYTETIKANGHTVVTDKAVAATCATAGKTEGTHCSVCNTVIKAQTTVAATGHTYGLWTTTKAATCTTAGTQTRTCTVCGNKETKSISATGHTVVTDKAVAATCTTAGKTEGTHCSVCNTVIKAQTTVAATGHSYTTEVIAPTATEQGYTLHTCSGCGDSYKDSYTDPKGTVNEPTIKVESVTGKAGDTVQVKVVMENNPGIVSFKVNVEYDSSAMTLQSIDEGDFANTVVSPTESNPIAITWTDSTSKNNATNGTVAVLTFKVNDSAKGGNYPLTVTYDCEDVFDENFENVEFKTTSGSITVQTGLIGDVNSDGKVNMKDVVTLQRYISDWNVEADLSVADVNNDNKVNMKDVVVLQRYLSEWDVTLG